MSQQADFVVGIFAIGFMAIAAVVSLVLSTRLLQQKDIEWKGQLRRNNTVVRMKATPRQGSRPDSELQIEMDDHSRSSTDEVRPKSGATDEDEEATARRSARRAGVHSG